MVLSSAVDIKERDNYICCIREKSIKDRRGFAPCARRSSPATYLTVLAVLKIFFRKTPVSSQLLGFSPGVLGWRKENAEAWASRRRSLSPRKG